MTRKKRIRFFADSHDYLWNLYYFIIGSMYLCTMYIHHLDKGRGWLLRGANIGVANPLTNIAIVIHKTTHLSNGLVGTINYQTCFGERAGCCNSTYTFNIAYFFTAVQKANAVFAKFYVQYDTFVITIIVRLLCLPFLIGVVDNGLIYTRFIRTNIIYIHGLWTRVPERCTYYIHYHRKYIISKRFTREKWYARHHSTFYNHRIAIVRCRHRAVSNLWPPQFLTHTHTYTLKAYNI
jgi:hypothetical protein